MATAFRLYRGAIAGMRHCVAVAAQSLNAQVVFTMNSGFSRASASIEPGVCALMERMQMERSLATPADAEIILKLYDLRRETLMREARAWVIGEFWPETAEQYFAVVGNADDPHSPFVRQVLTYWEMAAAFVLHGALSPELFVDCNAEGFFLLAKFAPILSAVRERNPVFLQKTSEMVKRFSAAAAGYEAVQKDVETLRVRAQEYVLAL